LSTSFSPILDISWASVQVRALLYSIVKVLFSFQRYCETKGAFVISEEGLEGTPTEEQTEVRQENIGKMSANLP